MNGRARYWYKFTMFECPVCGRGGTSKERKFTPKPKDAMQRYEFVQWYDQCEGW